MKKAVKGTCVFADKMRSKINQRLQNKQKRAKSGEIAAGIVPKNSLQMAREGLQGARDVRFWSLKSLLFSRCASRIFHRFSRVFSTVGRKMENRAV